MKIKHVLILFVSVLLVATVVASWVLKPKDISVLGLNEQHLLLNAVATCQARPGPCVYQQGKMSVSLSLPGTVEPLHTFEMHLKVSGIQPSRAVATFTMVGMDMGLNRFSFKQGADGSWQGEALLPTCSLGRKDWRVAISLRTDEGDYRVSYPFTIQ